MNIPEDMKQQYDRYLSSNKWHMIRNQRLIADRFTCAVCGSPLNLQVHHLNYQNIGNQELDDLITLCKTCHRKIEEYKDRYRMKSLKQSLQRQEEVQKHFEKMRKEQEVAQRANRMSRSMLDGFIMYCLQYDYSNNGVHDFTKCNTVCEWFKEYYQKRTGQEFPDNQYARLPSREIVQHIKTYRACKIKQMKQDGMTIQDIRQKTSIPMQTIRQFY